MRFHLILVDTVIEEKGLYLFNMHNIVEKHLVSALHPCEAGAVRLIFWIVLTYHRIVADKWNLALRFHTYHGIFPFLILPNFAYYLRCVINLYTMIINIDSTLTPD
jgi:hypothetical protein